MYIIYGMIILIHTSKTMRPPAENTIETLSAPVLIAKARELSVYAKTLTIDDIYKTMHVSEKLAVTTKDLLDSWTDQPGYQRAAIDSFLGDIYSGLQVGTLTDDDRGYANEHMRILSGLYGIVRPLDGVYPYRFEMGYRFASLPSKNLYTFWGDAIAKTLPENDMIVDLSAVEYGKTVMKYVDPARIISPRFLTISPKTRLPIFVAVHAKIARGAFAHWMIKNRTEDVAQLNTFHELGYVYDAALSTEKVPVFVCQYFGGIGLSVRLS